MIRCVHAFYRVKWHSGRVEMAPFTNVIYKCNFLNENNCILVHILLKSVANGSFENKLAFCTYDALSSAIVKAVMRNEHVSDLIIFSHDDVIKWKHFPRYWPSVRGIQRSTVNSLTKASDVEFSLICLKKRLSKQLIRRWFEKPSRSLWRHCNLCYILC